MIKNESQGDIIRRRSLTEIVPQPNNVHMIRCKIRQQLFVPTFSTPKLYKKVTMLYAHVTLQCHD